MVLSWRVRISRGEMTTKKQCSGITNQYKKYLKIKKTWCRIAIEASQFWFTRWLAIDTTNLTSNLAEIRFFWSFVGKKLVFKKSFFRKILPICDCESSEILKKCWRDPRWSNSDIYWIFEKKSLASSSQKAWSSWAVYITVWN